jgi:hypothetical protein
MRPAPGGVYALVERAVRAAQSRREIGACVGDADGFDFAPDIEDVVAESVRAGTA